MPAAPDTIVKTLLTWEDDAATNTTAGALEIDATSLIGFEAAAEVTEHPVESGPAVGDHVRPKNGTISLEGVITNTPITLPATQMNGVTIASASVTLPGGGTAVARQYSGVVDRVRVCDNVLLGLTNAGAIVSLTSGLRIVDSLAITRYRVEKNTDTGHSVRITMELKRVRIATTARAAVPLVRRARVTLERGAQPADNRSAAARIQDSAPMQTLGRLLTGN